jgi:predicted dehydrogenase
MDGQHRVAVVGAGWWTDVFHLPGLRARPDVEVVALCSPREAAARALAEKHGIPAVFTDYAAMLAQTRPEVVVIVTPNHTHHPLALAAIQAGAHVICEKPLALNATQALEMWDAAEAAGRRHLTVFTYRAVPAAGHIKALIAQGYLGRPTQVNARYVDGTLADPARPLAWRLVKAQAGSGALGDVGSHIIDLLRWWLGDFRRVVGQTAIFTPQRRWPDGTPGTVDADDACLFLAELACGAQAIFQAGKVTPGRANYQYIEVSGTEGTLVYETDLRSGDTFTGHVWGTRRGDQAGLAPLPMPSDLTAGLQTGDTMAATPVLYRRLTDSFFASLAGSPQPVSPSFADGWRAQQVIDAVLRSVDSGHWEAVEEP